MFSSQYVWRGYLFFSKKTFISFAHSSAKIPEVTVVLGCKTLGADLEKPRFSSLAP